MTNPVHKLPVFGVNYIPASQTGYFFWAMWKNT